MTLLKLLLAAMALALAAVGVVATTGGTQSGGGTVITDPNSGGGSNTGTVDRGDTTGGTTGGTQTTTRSAQLSWMAPLARENGDALLVGEITGYRIRIERQGSTTVQTRSVTATATTSTISLTSAGTYYFSIAAVDAAGMHSAYSSRVSKTVN